MRLKITELAEIISGELISGSQERIISGVSTDSRAVKPGEVFFALKGERFDGHNFVQEVVKKGAVAVVVRRGFSQKICSRLGAKAGVIGVGDTLYGLGELARYYRAELGIKVVGITGSVGKTTTKEITALILSKLFRTERSLGNFNNLVGVPITILRTKKRTEVLVLELATNQPGEIARLSEIAQPNSGIITRIGEVHLEGLKNLEGVEREKRALAGGLGSGGTLVFNLNDPRVARIGRGFAGKRIGYGFKARIFKELEQAVLADGIEVLRKKDEIVQRFQVQVMGDKREKAEVEMKGFGEHLVENALAGIGAGLAMGMGLDEMVNALVDFELIAGRGRLERVKNGVWLLDDSYNASPVSMKQALNTFAYYLNIVGGSGILVLGEMMELGDYARLAHKEIGRVLRGVRFDALYYLGKYGQELFSGLGKEKRKKAVWTKNLEELKELLEDKLLGDELVLVKGSHRVGLWRIADWLRGREDAL